MARKLLAALALALVLCTAAYAADANTATHAAAPANTPVAAPVAVPEATPVAVPEATPIPTPEATTPEATPVAPPAAAPAAAETVATPVPVSEISTAPVATPVPVPEATAAPAAPAVAEPVSTPAAATPATPAAPQPVAEPVTATPVIAEPVTATPVVAEPVTATPVIAEPAVATPVAAAPTPAPAAPVEATPAAPANPAAPTTIEPPTTTSTTTTTTPTGSSTSTTTVETSQDPPAAVAEEPAAAPAPKDPCLAVPGCTACIASASSTSKPSGSRKLMQGGMGGMLQSTGGGRHNLISGVTTSGKPTFNFDALLKSPYDEPNLPMCTACDVPGYTRGVGGKCNCAAGHGDIQPTGYCNLCPDGFVSLGGHRAVCVECENVAWSTDDRTMCICASGWYGYTNSVTRQATCNQCPGTRPVSKDGSRSAAECRACPTGAKPNEIFDDCVASAPAPPPPPMTLADLLGQGTASSPSPPPAPPAPRLYNDTTFETAGDDWKFQSRATRNSSANPISDFIGSVAEKMIMGQPINAAANITQPGDLLYQVLTKPAAQPKAPSMEALASLGGLGAALGTAAGALPNLATAVQSGDFVKVVETLGSTLKSVDAATQGLRGAGDAAGGNQLAQLLSGLAGSGNNDNANGLGAVLSGLSGLAGGNAGGSSSGQGLGQAVQMLAGLTGNGNNAGLAQIGGLLSGIAASQAKGSGSSGSDNGLGNVLQGLQGLVKVVSRAPAPTPVKMFASTPASSGMGAMLANAAKTAGGFVKVPPAPAKRASNMRLAKPAGGSSTKKN